MALYNDIVMDNFLNPKNVGELENPDGTGVYGSPVCGDMMQIQINVDENDVITDAKFKTFGCGSAIASSSMATTMIIGKTVEEEWKVIGSRKTKPNKMLFNHLYARTIYKKQISKEVLKRLKYVRSRKIKRMYSNAKYIAKIKETLKKES